MVRAAGDGGGSAVLAMTDEAVTTARRRYTGLADLCAGIADELPRGYSLVTESCGSFFAQIDPGITSFTASWQTALMLTADEARLIARNVNQVSLDVTELDRTLSEG
ncbi:hypothetical protein [Nocardioides sp.]|uniref:hypothetical protein n=1 Tax=Nocardioides sp. TaxID=35761 RepID=UPI00272705F6|nr:hypothetical protein [Nocardioides sp.]MDO9457663.1 hypothetical protein [Nocardioides sp.]